MKRNVLMILPLALALFAAVGCDTINTTEREEPIGRANYINDKRVVTDAFLASYARVQSVNTAEMGDITKVQVTLKNETPFDQRINYKFEWFDLSGMIVESPMSMWQMKSVIGKEVYVLTGVAPTPQAKDFRLKLQENQHN